MHSHDQFQNRFRRQTTLQKIVEEKNSREVVPQSGNRSTQWQLKVACVLYAAYVPWGCLIWNLFCTEEGTVISRPLAQKEQGSNIFTTVHTPPVEQVSARLFQAGSSKKDTLFHRLRIWWYCQLSWRVIYKVRRKSSGRRENKKALHVCNDSPKCSHKSLIHDIKPSCPKDPIGSRSALSPWSHRSHPGRVFFSAVIGMSEIKRSFNDEILG